jgi:hypothetical protein
MKSPDLSPLYRHSVGFDPLFSLSDGASLSQKPGIENTENSGREDEKCSVARSLGVETEQVIQMEARLTQREVVLSETTGENEDHQARLAIIEDPDTHPEVLVLEREFHYHTPRACSSTRINIVCNAARLYGCEGDVTIVGAPVNLWSK